MASKGKPKYDLTPGPAATAVVEEAVAGGPPAAAVSGSGATGSAPPAEGDQAAAPPAPEQQLPPLPTHLDASAGPLPQEHTPEEALSALNGLVADGVITHEVFSRIYLRELEPLGATQEDADRHWEALQEKLEAERTAAEELAARMLAEATEPPGIRAWNPLEDPEAARAKAEQLRELFNGMVEAIRQERLEAGSSHHTPGYLKDKIAKTLSQRAGLKYSQADELVHAWAGTSSDSEMRSVALQMAAAEKFGLEPTPYVAKQDHKFIQPGQSAEYAGYRDQARLFVDAMYSTTQEWLAERGIKELVLWRGMQKSVGTSPEVLETIKASGKPLDVDAHLNPMNSWSASYDKAKSFAAGGFILSARVPTSQVIGSCFTGTGCLHEQEFVVLGGKEVNVTAAALQKVDYEHVSGGEWDGGS
jgi:hypothetical protein